MLTTARVYRTLLIVAAIVLTCGSVTTPVAAQLAPEGLVIAATRTTSQSGGVSEMKQAVLDIKWALACYDLEPWRQSSECQDELEGPSIVNYDIKIKGNRLRIDSDGFSMLAALAADGSVGEWGILDPSTGRVNAQASEVFNNNTRAYGTTSLLDGLGEVFRNEFTFDRTSQTKSMLDGYTARRYTYSHIVALAPTVQLDGDDLEYGFHLQGEAWIAELGPFAADPRVAGIARLVAQSVGNQGFGSFGTEFSERGMVLATSDVTDFYVTNIDKTFSTSRSTSTSLEKWTTEFAVTAIIPQPLDDALFSGFERAETRCDCSCKGWTDLQEVKKNPDDPRAMGLAMCAAQCTPAWFREKCFD